MLVLPRRDRARRRLGVHDTRAAPKGPPERATWLTGVMAEYDVNEAAVAHARDLIDKHQYVLDSDWGDVQPDAEAENAYLERHSWDEYAAWHLGLTEGATDETKGALCVRGRRPPSGAPERPHRLRLPRRGVAPQEGRARGARPAPAPRRDERLRA